MTKIVKNPSKIALAFGFGILFISPIIVNAEPARPVILDRGPSADYASALSGAYAQRIGDPLLAARAFEKSWQNKRNDAPLFYKATDSYFMAGDIASVNRLAKSANARVLSGESKLVLATDELLAGRKPKAAEMLTGIDLGGNRALFGRQLLAWSLIAQGKKDEAIVVASRSSGNRSVDKNANYSRALMYQFMNDKENAQISFETAFDSGARASIGVAAYSRFLAANGEKSKALKILEDAAPDSDSPEWLYSLRDELRSQNTAPAIATGNQSNLKGFIAQSLGSTALGISMDPRNGGGLGELAIASKFDPNLSALKIQAARILIGNKLEREANQILKDIAPNSVFSDTVAAIQSGLLFENDKNGAELIARNALRARPNITNRLTLAAILAGMDKFAEAEALYSQVLGQLGDKPTNETGIEQWRIYMSRANALLELKKDDAAIKDLRHALSLDPNNHMLLNFLGYTLAERKIDLEDALVKLQEAVRLDPRNGANIDSLGWALFQLGRYNEAVDQLEVAISLEPSNGVIMEHLGDVYYKLGNKIEAQLEWQKSVLLLKKPADINRVKQKLEKGLEQSSNNIAVAAN